MKNGHDRWVLILGLIAGDAATLLLVTWLATSLRYGLETSSIAGPLPLVALILIPAFLALFWVQHLYDEEYLLNGVREYARAVTACSYGTLAVMVISYIAGSSPIVSRLWLIAHWGLATVLICVWRFVARRIIRRIRQGGRLVTPIIIVGASDQGVAIAQQLDTHGSDVVGFVDDYLPVGALVTTTRSQEGRELHTHRVLGSPDEIQRIARERDVHDIIVVPQALSWESFEAIVRNVALGDDQLRVRLTPGLYDVMATSVRALPRGGVPLMALEKARLTGVDRILKGALDRGLAAAALLALSPLLMTLLALGKLAGHQAVLERRQVRGLGGRPCDLLLFGPWLARHRVLCGLPSLISVLQGQVSLVGPRPQLDAASDVTGTRLGGLLVMKPGLTGLWRLASGDAPQLWLPDLWYVRNYTIWEDVRILFRTLSCLAPKAHSGLDGLRRWRTDDMHAEAGTRASREPGEARLAPRL